MRTVARWVVVAAIVSLGACSGPDQSTPTTRGDGGVVSDTAPVTIDGVETTPAAAPAPTDVLSGTIDPANTGFCERMIAYQQSIDFDLGSANPGSSNDSVRSSMEEMLAALKATRQDAPGAVGESVDTYVKAVQGVLNLIARHGYDMSATIQSSDGAKLKAIVDDPAVIAAGQALADASASVCGYVPT